MTRFQAILEEASRTLDEIQNRKNSRSDSRSERESHSKNAVSGSVPQSTGPIKISNVLGICRGCGHPVWVDQSHSQDFVNGWYYHAGHEPTDGESK